MVSPSIQSTVVQKKKKNQSTYKENILSLFFFLMENKGNILGPIKCHLYPSVPKLSSLAFSRRKVKKLERQPL